MCFFGLDFLKAEEGQGFSGQVCIVADSVGSILAYDALCRATKYQSRHGSENSILDSEVHNRGKWNIFVCMIKNKHKGFELY